MIGVHVLFQLAVAATEHRLEAVFHLGVGGAVQYQGVVWNAKTVSLVDILPCQRHQKDHGAVAIGQGMEDIQRQFLSFYAYAVQKAVLILEPEVLQGLQRPNLRGRFAAVQIPPESTGFEGATEGRYAFCYRQKGFLQKCNIDVI